MKKIFSLANMMKAWLVAVLLFMLCLPVFAAKRDLAYPITVDKFYVLNDQHPFWFTANPFSEMIRERFLAALDSSSLRGLDKERYHYSDIKSKMAKVDSSDIMRIDRLFTDGLVAYTKDVYQGGNVVERLANDEVSAKHAAADDSFVIQKLYAVNTVPAVDVYLASIERHEPVVLMLEDKYLRAMATKSPKVDQLRATLNYYRWIKHFNFDNYIIVNIPAAKLRYYEGDEVKLEMKVVVGKTETKTPRFSSYCKEVVLYPYWNVPSSITAKELLPKFKKDPGAFESMNMQVVDKRGRVVNGVDFSNYDRYDFPYIFRQYTGCDNALGVIKFNLTDPFDVYLHDTNNKLAFKKDARFLSHGCIRVEKPLELANILLNNEVDEGLIKACVHGQEPIYKKVRKPVPVFVLYMTADVASDSVHYYKDIYNLM